MTALRLAVVVLLSAGLAAVGVALTHVGEAPPSAVAGKLPPHAAQDRAAARATLRAGARLVGLDPARLGVRVALAHPRPGLAARYDRERRMVTIFAAPGTAPHRVAHDLAHELAHAVDVEHLTATDRRAYLLRRGSAGAAWWPGPDASDYGVGSGDFAEVFALCHAASPVFRSRLAPRPADPCAVLGAAASRIAARASKVGV
jgi:hypothetical protein